MRSILLLAALGLFQPGTSLAAQARTSRWAISFHVSRDAFRGGSSDASSVSGARIEVLPAPRVSYELGLARRLGRAELQLALGYAAGALRASSPSLVVEDHTGDLIRLRARLLLGHSVWGNTVVRLLAAVGPAVEHWTASDFSDHTTFSGHVGVILRIGQGKLSYENRLFFGLGGSPFQAIDVPAPARRESLKTWSLGAGLRYRL